MRRQSLKIADDGYNILLKACDFFIINAVLSLLISSQVRDETAVDFAAGFLVVTPIDLLMVKFTFYKRSNNLIVHLFAFR
ncbi:hypothetical protein ACUHZR_15015, partial [Photobacterium damselae subsp. piscicida]